MLKGFNSDITAKGLRYHVQSEDWGAGNPFLVTRVFLNGAVIRTVKLPYQDAHKLVPAHTNDGLRWVLQKQHSDVIEGLMSGEVQTETVRRS